MGFLENAKQELGKTPLALAVGTISVVIAALSLGLAYQQGGSPAPSSAPISAVTPRGFLMSNLALGVAGFLGAAVGLAWLCNLMHRRQGFAGMVASVPAGVLACTISLLIIYLAPPRELTPETFAEAKDLVYYGVMFIFAAVNGRATIDYAKFPAKKNEDQTLEQAEKEAGSATLFSLLVMVAIWCTSVSGGFEKIAKTLMPEMRMTHAVSAEIKKP